MDSAPLFLSWINQPCTVTEMWKIYALLSALFAALTAICAKVGVKDVDSNLATAIRATVILFLTWGIVFASGHLQEVKSVSPKVIAGGILICAGNILMMWK